MSLYDILFSISYYSYLVIVGSADSSLLKRRVNPHSGLIAVKNPDFVPRDLEESRDYFHPAETPFFKRVTTFIVRTLFFCMKGKLHIFLKLRYLEIGEHSSFCNY